MLERDMASLPCTSESTLIPIPWSYQTNWIVAHGSLESSVAVESSDHLIPESHPSPKSPLTLKPPASDSAPCEIKICFKQNYEVGQIYVRSSAHAYEIYYATSPLGINEYLSTIRCGVAERDGEVLQASCVDVTKEHGECLSGDVIAESASSGGSTVNSEDEWVKINGGSSPTSDKFSADGLNNIQNLYEATAQIEDLDPCLSLTIRLLSLQDKGCVYVDEIYVFVDSVQSSDSGNEAVLGGSSAQSSLMAMFMPTLLQLSKSGASRGQETHAFDDALKNGKMENISTVIDKIDSTQQHPKPKGLVKETDESAEVQQPKSAEECVETKNTNSSQPGNLEIAMEQLTSRMSRLEDICLRFEEKMLKPIERIEARLQQVEHQLEKLAKSSHGFGLPHCTRISAPEFSCSESNLSSFYNDELEKKDFTCDNTSGSSHEANLQPGLVISAPEFSPSEGDKYNDNLEPWKDSSRMEPKKLSCSESNSNSFYNDKLEKKDFTCENMSGSSHEANFHPGLIISAPEFSPSEGDKYNDNLEPLKDSPRMEPKKLSVDDALASAFHGFLFAAINPSEPIQTPIGLLGDVTAEIQNEQPAESCQVVSSGVPAAENDNREPSRYAQVLTVKAPEFTADETDSEEQSNFDQSTLDMASIAESEEKDQGTEMVPPSIESNSLFQSDDSCSIGRKESTNKFDSASDGDPPAVSVMVSGTCLDENLRGNSVVNMIETYFDESSGPAEIFSAKDSRDTSMHQISQETNLEKLTSCKLDDQDAASEDFQKIVAVRSIECDAEHVSEPSPVSFVDLDFPILEVRFAIDVHTSTKSPLEALLDDSAEPNIEAPSVSTKEIDAVSTNNDEANDLVSSKGLLLDLEVSSTDASLEGPSHCSEEMAASLI